MKKTCKSCGKNAIWFEDPDDYFYREDILFCEACCKHEELCDCLPLIDTMLPLSKTGEIPYD